MKSYLKIILWPTFINLVYLYSKYQNFFSSNSGEISSTVESLNFYLNQQFENILKTDEMKINNSKFEVIYLMKLIFNILYSKAKNLNIKRKNLRSELRKKIGEIRKYSINQQVTVGKENEGTVLYICMNFFKGTVSREKCSN